MVRAQKGEQGFFARGFTIGVKGSEVGSEENEFAR